MATRPITLFGGQWTDLSFDVFCEKARKFGYDGVEIPCSPGYFDVTLALKDEHYVDKVWSTLSKHGLTCYALSNHLVGQAVCDLVIDERHKKILPAEIWGDGVPENIRKRAAQKMIDTAKAAKLFFSKSPKKTHISPIVTGFTGSSIWHSVYPFPPIDKEYWERGFDDFAQRWTPILDEFDKHGVNFALEVHPSEIAFDIFSAQKALSAIKEHPRFGFNFDPSHFGYQGVDYVKFIYTFGKRIFHCHVKDVWWGKGDGTIGVFGGMSSFGDPRRYWEFRTPGRGNIKFEDIIVALNYVGYTGPLSVEWEDPFCDREHGAQEALQFVKKISFPPAAHTFDVNFGK
eukprot:TRINITY_DN1013_c0_g1_i1.p1 TRINITY_DN1013_c0_g1~~TRINITY_DN1013_c0_g1_i1.p1  ORF type:complete len:344 (+),score=64.80 TRINITY_DN1013_c0_g1_i1:227-1258(+)